MTKSNGIASLKQAAKLLNRHAPDGESLAYINPEEAKLLKSYGGSGIQTLSGVPSYFFHTWLKENVYEPFIKPVAKWLGYTAPTKRVGEEDVPIFNPKTGERIGAPRSIVTDLISTWSYFRAKKDKEGLNQAEQAEFDRLNQQLASAKTEFNVGTAEGTELKPEYETDITKSAAYRPITFDAAGATTPDLTTTAVAQGGRIGAFNGGIQGLMPQQAMPQQAMPQQAMPQPGFMPQPGLDPRMGYAAQGGRIGFNSGGETAYEKWLIDKYDLLVSDLSWDDYSKYSKLFRDQKAQGGRIGAADGYPGPHLNMPTFSEGVNQEFPSNELGVLEGQSNIDVSNIQGTNTQQEIQKLAQEIMGLYADIDIQDAINMAKKILQESQITGWAHGGRIGAQGGGIMPLLDMGGMEKDYRQDGGFVPIGRKEKADDVPARLSKNEFVFTADAVKAAGGGDIDEGAQRMYNVMKNLEAGGEISEQSQGQG